MPTDTQIIRHQIDQLVSYGFSSGSLFFHRLSHQHHKYTLFRFICLTFWRSLILTTTVT